MNNTNFYKITYNMNGGANTNVEKININVLIFLSPATVATVATRINLQLENRLYSGNELKQLIITFATAPNNNIPISPSLDRWHLLDKEGRNIAGENADAKREIIDQSTYKLIPRLLAGPGPA